MCVRGCVYQCMYSEARGWPSFILLITLLSYLFRFLTDPGARQAAAKPVRSGNLFPLALELQVSLDFHTDA